VEHSVIMEGRDDGLKVPIIGLIAWIGNRSGAVQKSMVKQVVEFLRRQAKVSQRVDETKEV